jgi:peptidyl-prolyl cis-trans isomerase B (cyclophilin B)
VSKAKSTTARTAPLVDPDPNLMLPETWRRRPWIPALIVVAVLAVVLGSGFAMGRALQPVVPAELSNCKTSTQLGPREFAGRQPMCIVAGKVYTATLNTTQGNIVMTMLPQWAPVTVNNFVVLAVNGFYNGLTFWDVPDWEAQAGDPLNNGQGGPGYDLPEEPSPLTWDPGAVGMSRVPGGPINGSQFFILKTAWPNGGPGNTVYNRFATVTGGLDKVSALAPGDRINTVTITVSNPVASPSR